MCAISKALNFEQDVFPAVLDVREAFLPYGGEWIGEDERLSLERKVDRGLSILYSACYALACDIVTKRVYGKYHLDWGEDISDAACEAIIPLFGSRKRSSGCLVIVGVIDSLFRQNPYPTGADVKHWLQGTLNRLVSNVIHSRMYDNSPEYVKTAMKVKRYLRNSDRYLVENSIVRGVVIELDSSELMMPEANEIVSACGRVNPMPTAVPEAVDLIMDLLSEDSRWRASIRLPVLCKAVFEILDPRLPDPPPPRRSLLPSEEYLLGRVAEAIGLTIDQARREYEWRKGWVDEVREAFLSAGEDYLYDLCYRDDSRASERQYLAAYLDGCTSVVYGKKYKGSFHNFLLSIRKIWCEHVIRTGLPGFGRFGGRE